MQTSYSLLLTAHGTRDPDGVQELLHLLGQVRQALPEYQVEAGVLEFPNARLPSVEEAVDRCLNGNGRGLAVLPLLLHQAGHSKRDVPGQLRTALEHYPELQLSTCPSLGIQAPVLDIVAERASEAERPWAPTNSADSALLLVGRGSSDPQANAEFFEIPPLLKERTRYGQIEGCFVSLAEPCVAEGIERCLQLGARRVVVVPYFLSTGILVKRIGSQVAAAQAFHPRRDLVVGSHIGVHPKLIRVLVEHAQVLLAKIPVQTEGIPA